MPTDAAVRWNVRVSKATDVSLRSFLDSQGKGKGALSEFVEQAVLAQVFHSTIEDIHARNRGADTAAIEAEVAAAIGEVRVAARGRGRTRQRKA